jgi:1-acyl-sn-glycerol-3-phosphate acyltransferase
LAIRQAYIRLFFLLECLVLMPIARALLGLRVKGPRPRPDPKGIIVAPNHQSWIDPLIVQYGVYPLRITFLMTELFFDLPILGFYFRSAGARPIREGGPSVAGMRASLEALEEGEVICIFPEGEITKTGELGEGQRGVARIARRTGATVLPMGIRGAINVFSKVQKLPRLARVEVRLGKPMRFDEEESAAGERRFTKRLMDRIKTLSYDE